MFVIIDREETANLGGTICTDQVEATKLGNRNVFPCTLAIVGFFIFFGQLQL